jgi:hypothetical protein
MQAKDKNLVLQSKFININLDEKAEIKELFSPIIETDEQRLKQVLLSL